MKLNQLKPGMVCKLRNNEVAIVVEDGKGYYYYHKHKTVGNLIVDFMDTYNEDLTHKWRSFYDIMEITYGDKEVFKRKESNRWFVPELEEEYFCMDSYGEISSTNNMQVSSDTKILNSNRVFKTKEEAEKRARQQQATLSIERWIAEKDVEVDINDPNVLKHYLTYDIETKEFETIYSHYRVIIPKQFILSSEEKAKQLIKEREKELKIMFGVEE